LSAVSSCNRRKYFHSFDRIPNSECSLTTHNDPTIILLSLAIFSLHPPHFEARRSRGFTFTVRYCTSHHFQWTGMRRSTVNWQTKNKTAHARGSNYYLILKNNAEQYSLRIVGRDNGVVHHATFAFDPEKISSSAVDDGNGKPNSNIDINNNIWNGGCQE